MYVSLRGEGLGWDQGGIGSEGAGAGEEVWWYKEFWLDREPEEVDEGRGVVRLVFNMYFPMERVHVCEGLVQVGAGGDGMSVLICVGVRRDLVVRDQVQ